MIARLWRGRLLSHDAGRYLTLMEEIALPDYRATPGNLGAWCLHRGDGRLTEVCMLSLWQDLDAIRRFAGEPATTAKYYDFDAAFLVAMPAHAEHFEVLGTGRSAGCGPWDGAGDPVPGTT